MILPDRERLIGLAGERVFQRGAEYFTWRRVREIAVDTSEVRGLVDGARCYRVVLRIDDRQVLGECDCPQGEAGRFCKHCVAVCLALSEPKTGGGLSRKGFDLEAVRCLLQAAVDAVATADDVEPSPVILGEVKSSLGELLNDGFAQEVAELVEETLPLICSFQNQTSACRELAGCLLSFYRRSCVEPEALARRLCEWQTTLGMESETIELYFDLLGDRVMRVFQRLLESEWDKVKPRDGDIHTAHFEGRVKFARLTKLLEVLAQRRGDLDSLIAIKSQRLDSAADYLEIARLYKRIGDGGAALRWALRGAGLFQGAAAGELYEFLGQEFEAREDWPKALEVAYLLFSVRPSLERYQRMAWCARRIGEWEIWRERALSAARMRLAEASLSASRRRGKKKPSDQSVLVRILLWDGDEEAAWKAAQEGDCEDGLQAELAVRRAGRQPEESLRIYKNLVTRNVGRKNNYAYRRAIELLRRIGRLMRKQKRRDEFIEDVKRLRQTHRAQHNFARLLDAMIARYDRRPAG